MLMDLSSEIYHSLLPVFITVTLGLPVAALGAIDGFAEATANFARLVSGRLSDRSLKRKPWIAAGYGLAALSKPLFPLASGAGEILGARFLDRVGKGIRGSPRDALVADETPPEIRGHAYGLRQALDTVGALLAPIAAIVLMWIFADDIRSVFWVAIVPAFLSFGLAWFALREPVLKAPAAKPSPLFRGFRDIARPTQRLIAVGFLFTLARFSEAFLVLKGIEVGLSPMLSPLALVLFNLSYTVLAYPAGGLSDRIPPRTVLMMGMAVLIAADLILAWTTDYVGLSIGILLWGAHMALTQGVFARMVADSAPDHLRATSFGAFWFVTGIATFLASLAAGFIWDRDGSEATFIAAAGAAAVALAMLSLLGDPSRERA